MDRIKELERELRELRQANEIHKKASAYFAAAELDHPHSVCILLMEFDICADRPAFSA